MSFEPRRTSPQPFRAALETLLQDLEAAPVQQTTSLVDRWGDVVGADLAAHTQPVGVRQGVLTVEADDPAYGEHLQWNERQYLAKLAELVGDGVVTALQVRIRRT